MTSRTRLIAALLGSAAFLAAAAWLVIAGHNEGASWTASERTAFMTSCVEQCRKAPGVTEAQYPRCDTACACAADEGEKTMTARELGSAALAINGGTASDEQKKKMDRVTAAGLSCVSGAAPDKK